MNMWAGRFKKQLDEGVNDFNSSIRFDSRMFREDIAGSMAHAAMLGRQGIISEDASREIIKTLKEILSDIECGRLEFDLKAEDIHMFIETELTKRAGDYGKMLHTARSRNDQVALDTRLYLRYCCEEITGLILTLIKSLSCSAEKYADTVMPGYTHLQRAQPITFGHHLCAYCYMLMRDIGRIEDAAKRMNLSPLGSCALAGTTYPLDRQFTAASLGFNGVIANSLDGVSDRDFAIELSAALSILMMHLSRFSEEVVLWCSGEFAFIEQDDAYSTGSSIMPQKKNPDIAELVRGKTGRVYGSLITLLTVMKGLPLAYNKDMQEDKEAVFDAVDTAVLCLRTLPGMIDTMTVKSDNMRGAAGGGFINATDCADYLVRKGLPFRSAYKITGTLVAVCIDMNTTLEQLPLKEYRKISELFEDDIYSSISLERCVEGRTSEGGPSHGSVMAQLSQIKKFIDSKSDADGITADNVAKEDNNA
ncbi:MAG: argininosuccinate lyase [Eubacteriales bacterium]